METARKLQEVGQAMELIVLQNDFMELLNNPEKVQSVDDLVEDIHYALMDYQVCTAHMTFSHYSNTCHRHHSDRISMTRAVKKL